jgi:hypothetical protein
MFFQKTVNSARYETVVDKSHQRAVFNEGPRNVHAC